MPLPASVSTGTVTGSFVYPNGSPAAGMVVFTPQVDYVLVAVDNVIILPAPTVVTLSAGGAFSVVLPATTDVDLNPTGWTYRVEVVVGQGLDIELSMSLTAGSTVDLADVAPASPSAGAVSYRWELFAEYTTPGTTAGILLPAYVREAEMVLIGAGGGGGSGRRGLTTEVRCGGGGGGAGASLSVTLRGSILTESFTVLIGTTATGGAAVGVDNTNGAAGTTPTNSSITAATSGLLAFAYSGTAGGGGGLGVAAAGGSGRPGVETGSSGVSGGAASLANGTAGAAPPIYLSRGPSGAGSGGGLTAVNVASAGGTGGYVLAVNQISTAGAIGTNGGAGYSPAAAQRSQGAGYGGGGGGGGSAVAAIGGNGGNGGFPGGGGGGGGASSNGFASGAGGAGGGSYAAIWVLR